MTVVETRVPGYVTIAAEEDDGRAPAALHVAAEGLREFNHRTLSGFDDRGEGWSYPSDAYAAIGHLLSLAARVEQACEQIIRPVRAQLAAGHIRIDPGTRHDGEPEAAVEEASLGLAAATQGARDLAAGLRRAHEALAFAGYDGPDAD